MGWRTRTSALPIQDLHQIAYLLPTWDGSSSDVVFLWSRLTCPQNSSLRMFRYRDLSSSHVIPRFGALEHATNRTPDNSVTFIGSRKKFCKRHRMAVCLARKRKPSILSVSYRLNRFNRLSRWRTTPFKFCAKIWFVSGSVAPHLSFVLLNRVEWHNKVEIESRGCILMEEGDCRAFINSTEYILTFHQSELILTSTRVTR